MGPMAGNSSFVWFASTSGFPSFGLTLRIGILGWTICRWTYLLLTTCYLLLVIYYLLLVTYYLLLTTYY